MNPELLDLLIRMGIGDPFQGGQVLGREPQQFQQSTEQLGQNLQSRGEVPTENPTFDLMSMLALAAMDQGVSGGAAAAPSNPAAQTGENPIIGFFKNLFSQQPDRSQSGTLEEMFLDLLSGMKDSDEFKRGTMGDDFKPK